MTCGPGGGGRDGTGLPELTRMQDSTTRLELERLAQAVATGDAEYAALPRDVFARLFPLPPGPLSAASAAAAHEARRVM